MTLTIFLTRLEPDAAQSPQRPDRGAKIGGCFRSLRQLRRPGLHLAISPLDLASPHGIHSRFAPRRLRTDSANTGSVRPQRDARVSRDDRLAHAARTTLAHVIVSGMRTRKAAPFRSSAHRSGRAPRIAQTDENRC